MRQINYDELTSKDLLDVAVLLEAYKKYLKEVLEYDDFEATFVASEMENPYNVPYVIQEHVIDCEIDGVEYSVRQCKTDFCQCGMFHLVDKEPFEFLMFFNNEDIENGTVGEYSKARKKYII